MPENAARNFSQKATTATIHTLEKSKISAQENRLIMEQSCVEVSKDAVDFNLQLIDMAKENMDAAFDFARQLPHVKSPSMFFELSAEHARKQFDNLTRQTQHLTDLAQKAMTDASQSWQSAAKTFDQPSS